jgi:opacity protein-like surface antigen
MQKTILMIAGSALIALSTVQFAAASEQRGRVHHRSTAAAQFRQSNAYVAPATIAVQPEWPGYGYGGGYYSHGFSAPAGQ